LNTKTKYRCGNWTLPLLCGLCCLSGTGNAANSLEYRPIDGASAKPRQQVGPTTREELEAFVDGFMSAQMAKGPVAGASVVVVKDGSLFFAKGYGYEDVEKRVPVDPEQTLFRPGSVSKLFTWTAIMQLVEQGKLDLDTDVNTYLKDMKLRDNYPQPVTLRNLMTHTAGFEDGAIGYLFADNEKDLLPLGTWLTSHVPVRARPVTTDFSSGANSSYSNWGTALAGHIVENISGMPFDDYIEQHILTPLRMSRSTFREPLPPSLAPRMSGGYMFEGGEFARRGFEFIHAAGPAGSMSTTATDMAKFMLAYLGNGTLGDARILAPESVRLMHTRAMSPDPAVNGSGLGFYETWINGHRVIGHGGDTSFFHSVVALLPESHLGLFATVNTGGEASGASVALERAFVQHYFPATLPPLKPRADAAQRNEKYAGTYRVLRRSYTRFEKIFAGLGDEKVVAMPDGTLLMPGPENQPVRWAEVGDGVFRAVDHDLFMAFKGDDGGRARSMVGPFAFIASERIHWYESSTLHAFIIAVGVVLFITTLIAAIRQRRADRAAAANIRWARPVLALTGVLLFAFLICALLTLAGGFEDLIYKIPTTLYVALLFPLLAIPFALAAVYFAVVLWRSRAWRFGARLHYTLATLAALAFLFILNYWNLLGYHFG
jgi:CubicO group peptidase (beta-lactamase class C family)